jgi:Domain of Unknown Function (DUF1080)
MKHSLRLATCLAFLFPLLLQSAEPNPAPNSASPESPAAETDLFNGKDLNGWVAIPRHIPIENVWTVANGVLHCVGKPAGYLRTEKAYKDYTLKVEWRFIKAGNTGVLVHINGPEKVWPNCVECQGMHKSQGDFWFQGGATCNDPAAPLKTAKKNYLTRLGPDSEKPVGEWNTFEVTAVGDQVVVRVNGTEVNRVKQCSTMSGNVGIQSEGAELEIRKVSISPASRKE